MVPSPLPAGRILTAVRPRPGAARGGAPIAGDCSPAGPQDSGRNQGRGAPWQARRAAPVVRGRRPDCPRPRRRAPGPRTAAAPPPPPAHGASVRASPSCPAASRSALRSATGARSGWAQTSNREWTAIPDPGRVLLSRAPWGKLLLLPAAKPFHAPGAVGEQAKRTANCAEWQPVQRPQAGPQNNFFASSLPWCAKSPRGPAARRGGDGGRAPIGPPGRSHPAAT